MYQLIALPRVCLIGIIFVSCSYALAQTKIATPQPIGSISGHVYIDGKAAAGVEVGAFASDSINRRVANAQSKTDSEGYYQLGGLPAANYQIMTFTPNLIVAENEPQSPMFGYFASAKSVLLAAGEDVIDINLKLKRGGVITGKVTDADDKPVVEERVTLQPVVEQGQPQTRMPYQVSASMYQTDDRGVYRIYGLPPGRYRVSVGRSANAGFTGTGGFYLLTYHPDATDINRAEAVDVAEGAEVKDVDIKVGARGETHSLTGRVVDAETNLPLSGLRIGIMFEQGGGFSSGNITGADGTFTIQGVTRGKYGVYVSQDSINSSDFYSDPVSVSVADEDVNGIEIKALHGVSVSGTVMGENIDLKDLLRQIPTLRVSINVIPADGRMTPTTIRSFGSATVAADGSFTVSGLRPGRVSLNVSSSDSAKRPSITKVIAGGVVVSQGFEIERQPVSGIQLVVAYGTGALRGSVTLQGGTLSEFRTEVICRRDGSRITGGAYLDARGHFTMNALVPGSYDCYLQFIPNGRITTRPPQPPHQPVTVSNDTEVEITFLVDLTPKGVGP
ncbi:MAG TPA: carboxypeptidase regulatory-like domain-containing protein [Pyrinomonadaceae bacterium]|jgi:hypothetical protein|nr:carboxypeptidase regulatory-like domain-containing protein [Pyrinomonadaceae bacterium]